MMGYDHGHLCRVPWAMFSKACETMIKSYNITRLEGPSGDVAHLFRRTLFTRSGSTDCHTMKAAALIALFNSAPETQGQANAVMMFTDALEPKSHQPNSVE